MIIQADGQGRAKMPSVMIGLNSEWIHAATMARVVEVISNPGINKELHIQDAGGEPAMARAAIAEHFLESKHDRLVMIEKGMAPSMGILDLLGFDRDVIGCPVPRVTITPNGPALQWNAFDDDGQLTPHKPGPDTGMEQVDGVGHGCLILSKAALQGRVQLFAANMVEFARSIRKDGLKFWCHFGSPCNAVRDTDGLAVNALLLAMAAQPKLKIATG